MPRAALLPLALIAAAPAFADMTTGVWPATPAPAGITAPKGMHYVWGDEFDGPDGAAPNPAKWGYEKGFVRNKEAQFYTEDRRENARLEKGRLVIEGRREAFEQGGKTARFTAASVVSEDKFAFKYGRIEIAAKVPRGVGTWPALWMMGQDRRKAGWPACGEIDILEHLGYEQGVVYCTVHTPGETPDKKHASSGGKIKGVKTSEGFRVYAMDWTPDKIVLSCDGKVVHIYARAGKSDRTWKFDKPHYLLMNLAIGGGWGGAKGIDEAAFPCRFEIDYVRVFQAE